MNYTIAQLLYDFLWNNRKSYQDRLLRTLLMTTESHLKQRKSGPQDYFMSGALNESHGTDHTEEVDADAPGDYDEDDDDLFAL